MKRCNGNRAGFRHRKEISVVEEKRALFNVLFSFVKRLTGGGNVLYWSYLLYLYPSCFYSTGVDIGGVPFMDFCQTGTLIYCIYVIHNDIF